MTIATASRPETGDPPEPGASSPRRRIRSWSGWRSRSSWSGWCLAIVFQGKRTLDIGGADAGRRTELVGGPGQRHRPRGTTTASSRSATASPTCWTAVITWLELLISTPAFPSPYPHIGFLGVVAIAWFITALVAGWRLSILTVVCFFLFSMLGFYEDSMNTLIVTGLAVVLSVLIGLPLAVWMAHSRAPARSSRRCST